MSVKAKSNYNKIFNLTEKLYGKKLAMPVKSKNHLTRWNDLFDYWEQLQDEDPLYPVVHKVHWGRYPYKAPVQTHGALYDLIEAEILNYNSSVHKARKPIQHIYRHLRVYTHVNKADVADDLCYHSDTTKEFMIDKTGFRLYGEDESFLLVFHFKRVIKKLIPVAKEWTDAQWSDDRNIFDAIQEKYNIDYRLYPDAFGQLYDLLDEMWNQGKEVSYADIFGIEHLSWKLAEEIWPDNTKKFILRKFCAAMNHARKNEAVSRYSKAIISEASLSKSWVMRYIHDLHETDKEKKMLFDMMMGR